MQCKKCGNTLQETEKFCTICGSKIDLKKQCPKCSAILEENQRFCVICGYELDECNSQDSKINNDQWNQYKAANIINAPTKHHSWKWLIGGGVLLIAVFLIIGLSSTEEAAEPAPEVTQVLAVEETINEEATNFIETYGFNPTDNVDKTSFIKNAITPLFKDLRNTPSNYKGTAIKVNGLIMGKFAPEDYMEGVTELAIDGNEWNELLGEYYAYLCMNDDIETPGGYVVFSDDSSAYSNNWYTILGYPVGVNSKGDVIIWAEFILNENDKTLSAIDDEITALVDSDFLNGCNLYTSEQIDNDSTLKGMPTYGYGRILNKDFANGTDTSNGYKYVIDAGIDSLPSFIVTTIENYDVNDSLVVWGIIGERIDSGRCNLDTYGAVKYVPGNISATQAPTQETDNIKTEFEEEYILPDIASRYYSYDDLDGLDQEQLRLARNEVYARHGRSFETKDLNSYFSSKSWYYGYLTADEFDDSVLNEFEKANLDLIKIIEAESVNSNQINQLTLDDIANISFGSNNTNVSMDIGTYSENNQIYIVFSRENEELWRGEWSTYQNLQYGGLSVTFEGYNSVTSKNDYLTVEWSAAESLDFPVVIYDYDTIGLSDSYSFSHILLGN